MEFDKSRVYTAVNADELKIGSKVIVANNLEDLRHFVECGMGIKTVVSIEPCRSEHRFITENENKDEFCTSLVYLVEEPQKQDLKWTDLKIGDIIRNKKNGLVYMITGVDAREVDNYGNANKHIAGNGNWLTDDLLTYWELA